MALSRSSSAALEDDLAAAELTLELGEAELRRTTTQVAATRAIDSGLSLSLLLDTGDTVPLPLGDDVNAALALYQQAAPTIHHEVDAGDVFPLPGVTLRAATVVSGSLSSSWHRRSEPMPAALAAAQAAEVQQQLGADPLLLAEVLQAADLLQESELYARCVKTMAGLVERAGSAAAVRDLFALRPDADSLKRSGKQRWHSAAAAARRKAERAQHFAELPTRIPCVLRGNCKELLARRALVVAVLGPAADQETPVLHEGIVGDVCAAIFFGIDTEPELRAACAAGGKEVVLDPDADITLSGDEGTDRSGHYPHYTWTPGTGPLQMADGTTLRGGGEGYSTLRGYGLRVEDGAAVRVERVAILDFLGTGIHVRDRGVVTVQDGRVVGSGSHGVSVTGVGARASLTSVVVERSQGIGIAVREGGVIAVQDGRILDCCGSGVVVAAAGSRARLTDVVVENCEDYGMIAHSSGVISLHRSHARLSRHGRPYLYYNENGRPVRTQDYYEYGGGRIACPYHAGEQPVPPSERGWCRACKEDAELSS